MSDVQIYSLKTPAERVAAKLLGTQRYRCEYKCLCGGYRWSTSMNRYANQVSCCSKCGVFRLPVEVWEE